MYRGPVEPEVITACHDVTNQQVRLHLPSQFITRDVIEGEQTRCRDSDQFLI